MGPVKALLREVVEANGHSMSLNPELHIIIICRLEKFDYVCFNACAMKSSNPIPFIWTYSRI